jgi:DNA-binding transcriptional LysR family regulator
MNTKPDIEYIMTYIKVVELGSFTSAAYDMNLSKSVVSKHVSSLEEALNVRLLKRTTRKLSVTDVGKVFYEQVKNIPYEVENAQMAIQPYNDEPHGLLRVISPANFIASLKEEVVPNYLLKHEKVNLNLRGVRPVDEYVNDEYDVIILWKLQHLNFPDYNMVGVKLFSMPIGIYAAPEYLEKHGTPQTPDDMVNFNCFSSAGRRWPFRERDGNVYYKNIDGRLRSKNDDIIHAACVAGVGIAYSYPFLFEKELRAGKVVQILQDYTQVFVEMYGFYHPTPYLPPKISAFIDELKLYYRSRQEEIMARGQIIEE